MPLWPTFSSTAVWPPIVHRFIPKFDQILFQSQIDLHLFRSCLNYINIRLLIQLGTDISIELSTGCLTWGFILMYLNSAIGTKTIETVDFFYAGGVRKVNELFSPLFLSLFRFCLFVSAANFAQINFKKERTVSNSARVSRWPSSINIIFTTVGSNEETIQQICPVQLVRFMHYSLNSMNLRLLN